LRRTGQEIELTFDERTSPFPRLDTRRLEGSIRLRAEDTAPALPIVLDETGRHLWWPVAPRARIEVDVPALGLQWSGTGYHDANAGERPLERDFSRWTWGRFHDREGETWVAYDALLRNGERTSQSLQLVRHAGHGLAHAVRTDLPASSPTGRTGWALDLATRCDLGARPTIDHVLEDAPFYARHLVSTSIRGRSVQGVTETLDLDRFDKRWVQGLLPFRMRRA
jgi:carotenoid 1,2-hydratase